jgi:hypothetical protein
VSGLKDATVTFYPHKGGTAFMQRYASDRHPWEVTPHRGANFEYEYDAERECYIARNITGKLVICHQEEKNIGDYKKLEFLR